MSRENMRATGSGQLLVAPGAPPEQPKIAVGIPPTQAGVTLRSAARLPLSPFLSAAGPGDQGSLPSLAQAGSQGEHRPSRFL